MTNERDFSEEQTKEDSDCCGNGCCRQTQDGQRQDGEDTCAKCKEYLAGWKRAQADYANLKNTFEKERKDIALYGQERLLHEILPVVDQFETAMEHLPDLDGLPDDEKKKMQNWLIGIKAVKQMWEQAFLGMGIERVDATGEFDPNKHFAVAKETDASKPPDTILRVVRHGWMWNGKVLRPANVIVNSSTDADSQTT